MLNIITQELYNKSNKINDGIVISPTNIDDTITLFQKHIKQTNKINIYDRTSNNKAKEGSIITVSDHLNKTGINPLIGRQKTLKIDFIDMTNIYNDKNGIITHCFGKKLYKKYDYPSHYLSIIVILARAIGFKTINGFLINIKWN